MRTVTRAAMRTSDLADDPGVADRAELTRIGFDSDAVAAQVAARRWMVRGKAVVLHNGPLTRQQRHAVALINCGPRAVLTSFTVAQRMGLQGWDRPETHVLAPAGTLRPHMPGLVLHRTGDWDRVDALRGRRFHRLAPALVIAASSFASPRPGAGLLAAAVQQRLESVTDLRRSVDAATRTRHRRELLLALDDIAGGSQALSEIDFIRLCRRANLPLPSRQEIRIDRTGKRRYLDAAWTRWDGRQVAVEVDGALHLVARRWWDDQLRQNEIVIDDTILLRYPSVVVRSEPATVIDQLRRVVLPPRLRGS